MTKSSFKHILRHGVYGIALRDSHILLTQKKSGPYQGLWGLPGGGIEFGETPEDTLRREFLEETALKIGRVDLLDVTTFTCEYERAGFHHVGLIYHVRDWIEQVELVPEEEKRWILVSHAVSSELTPFARFGLSKISVLKLM
jgi:8-oxo-dGTP diphosphatase